MKAVRLPSYERRSDMIDGTGIGIGGDLESSFSKIITEGINFSGGTDHVMRNVDTLNR